MAHNARTPADAHPDHHGRQSASFRSASDRVRTGLDEAWMAAEAMLGANPLLGMSRLEWLDAGTRLLKLIALNPVKLAAIEASLALEYGRIALGLSNVGPEPEDSRFRDPVWQSSRYYRRLMQSYLAWSRSLERLLDSINARADDKERARFFLSQFIAMAAPTNYPAGNPEFPARLYATRGMSLVSGFRNLLRDLRENRGLPRQVDEEAFGVGRNLAVTPGAVVYRDAVCEVIQYGPALSRVKATPLLIMPPQINKYYIIDLAPGRSLVEHAVNKGQQVFCISWRNPTAAQRNWGVETYVSAAHKALDAVLEITASPSAQIVAACAGGLTAAVLAGYLQAEGQGGKIRSLSLLVTVLDTRARSLLGLFANDRSIRTNLEASRDNGVLDGREMARAFAWLRPDDLVWRFYANNYVLGKRPPAFDILYWNNDSTRLPAQFHADMLKIFQANPLQHRGSMKILGRAIDLSAVRCPVFIVAGESDHITPWEACYRSASMFGGKSRFLLSSSGHIQSIVNPPDNRRARYREHDDHSLAPDRWKQMAQMHTGSWWDPWLSWLNKQAKHEVDAPLEYGSENHPPLGAAPGRYVQQK